MKFESQEFKIATHDNGAVGSCEKFGLVSPSGLFGIDQRGVNNYCVTHIPTGRNFNRVFTSYFLDDAITFVEKLEGVADEFRFGEFGENPTDERRDMLKGLVKQLAEDVEA